MRLEEEFVGSWPPTSFMGFPRPGLTAPAMLDPEDLPAPSGLRESGRAGSRRSSAHFSPGSRGRAEDLGDLADPLLGGRSDSQENEEGDSPPSAGPDTGSFASAGSLAGPKLARLKPPREPGRSLTNSPSFKPAAVAQHSAAMAHGALYGTICAIVNLPSLVSFTGIVFFAPVFFAKMPQLVKMFYLASAIQQAVFVLVGTLPFAVGQVQDVGLIILSSMAQSIASRCAADGVGEAKMLTTTLLFLAFSTICVGLCVGLASKVGISRYLQQVPLPVIGGYLGFVGYFCFAAGATLATDRHVSSLASWEAVMNRHDLVHFAPCLGSMVLYFASTRLSKHPVSTRGRAAGKGRRTDFPQRFQNTADLPVGHGPRARPLLPRAGVHGDLAGGGAAHGLDLQGRGPRPPVLADLGGPLRDRFLQLPDGPALRPLAGPQRQLRQDPRECTAAAGPRSHWFA